MKVWRSVVSILTVLSVLLLTACGTELPDSGSSSPLESSSSVSAGESTASPEERPSSGQQESAESSPAASHGGAASSAAPSSSLHQSSQQTGKTTFTLSITCRAALASDSLKESVRNLLPADGALLEAGSIEFTDGENAFDVVLRECRRRRIAVASVGSYIQSIGGLAEKDCGELSGWMCRVNGVFLDRSLKEYTLKDGDRVEWLYTCNLGKDL